MGECVKCGEDLKFHEEEKGNICNDCVFTEAIRMEWMLTKEFQERFVDRKELVEEIIKKSPARKGYGDILIWRSRVVNAIRNFGRED